MCTGQAASICVQMPSLQAGIARGAGKWVRGPGKWAPWGPQGPQRVGLKGWLLLAGWRLKGWLLLPRLEAGGVVVIAFGGRLRFFFFAVLVILPKKVPFLVTKNDQKP